MQNQKLIIPGIVFIILSLIGIYGIKLSPLWAVVIGFIGFTITYYLQSRRRENV